MQMTEDMDFEVRLENLPRPEGVRMAIKMTREQLVQVGNLFLRLSDDGERGGISLLFRSDGQITFETF